MHLETWQIICYSVGGVLFVVFEILTIIKNRKAKKAKKAAKSFYIDPNPEEEKDVSDE